MKNVIATWSGGKDSCLAAYKVMQDGHTLSFLANTVSVQYKRVRFHGIKDSLIQLQADCIGVPLLQKETTAEHYFLEFTENLKKGIDPSIDGIVFGDIHLDECLGHAKDICDELEVSLIEPLWHRKQIDILEELIDLGFEAIVASAQANLFGSEWVGRKIDKSFIRDISQLEHIDACGENGEFHTFVTNGPIFKRKIEILQSAPILRDNFWFLDIQKYR